MKKVLIITYYWPPAGGPGVQRVLKFAKYLPEFGWQTIILTVKNGEYPAIDESLEVEIPDNCKVYKTASIEPNLFYKKFTGMAVDEKIPTAVLAAESTNWKKRLANWIRLNLFVPDAKIGWIPFAVRKGKKIIKAEKPDIIFSSSPPPTVHLIARKLAKWSGIKWVADFRDPWTDIYHYDSYRYSRFAGNRNIKMEKMVLEYANDIVTVSHGFMDLFCKKISLSYRFTIIPNGFDEADFDVLPPENQNRKKFTIAYAGKINNQQNPVNLWMTLEKLINSVPEFGKHLEILMIGKIAKEVLNSLSDHGLADYLNYTGYLEHGDALSLLKQSNMLLLLIPNTLKNEGIIPGKIFEYMATEKFIIGVGPKDGDAAEILAQTNTGRMFEFNEIQVVRNEIKRQYINWQKGLTQKINREEIKKYSRKELTKKLVKVFCE